MKLLTNGRNVQLTAFMRPVQATTLTSREFAIGHVDVFTSGVAAIGVPSPVGALVRLYATSEGVQAEVARGIVQPGARWCCGCDGIVSPTWDVTVEGIAAAELQVSMVGTEACGISQRAWPKPVATVVVSVVASQLPQVWPSQGVLLAAPLLNFVPVWIGDASLMPGSGVPIYPGQQVFLPVRDGDDLFCVCAVAGRVLQVMGL